MGQLGRIGVVPTLSADVLAVAWSPDGQRFTAFTSDASMRFDVSTGRLIDSTLRSDPLTKRLTYLLFRNSDESFFRISEADYSLVDSQSGSILVEGRLPAAVVAENRPPRSLSMSADHRFVAGVHGERDQPGVIWLLDLAHQSVRRIVNDHADVRNVRLSPDGKLAYFVAGTDPPMLHSRDLVQNKDRWVVELNRVASPRTISPRGDRLVMTDGAKLRVFDTATGAELLAITYGSGALVGQRPIDISPDARWMAQIDGQMVQVWDLSTGQLRLKLPHAAGLVAFSPDGSRLLTVNDWPQVWKVPTFEPTLPQSGLPKSTVPAAHMDWAQNDRLLTTWYVPEGGDRHGLRLQIADTRTMRHLASLPIPADLHAIRLTRDGRMARWVTRGKATQWEWALDASIGPTEVPWIDPPEMTRVREVQLLDDGRVVIYRSDAAIGLHAIPQPFVLQRQDEDHVRRQITIDVRHSPNGPVETSNVEYIGAAHWGLSSRPAGMLTLWYGPRYDVLLRRHLPTLGTAGGNLAPTTPPLGDLHGLLVGRGRIVDNRRVVNLHDLLVWDSITGEHLGGLDGPLPDNGTLRVSPDSRWAAYASREGTVLFDVRTRRKVADQWPADVHAKAATNLAFSPGGRELAIAYQDGTIGIWSVPQHATRPWVGDDQAWTELGCGQVTREWDAAWHLLDHPVEAVKMLSTRMKPVPRLNDVVTLIAQLDDNQYRKREQAQALLIRSGEMVEGDITRALARPASAEQRDRLERVLNSIKSNLPPVTEVRRTMRGLWALQQINSPEARVVLERMAQGAPGSHITITARLALEGRGR